DMSDLGFDMRASGEDDGGGGKASGHSAGYECRLGLDGASHRTALADGDLLCGDVTLDTSGDMQLARGDDISGHLEVEAEDRGRRRLAVRGKSRSRRCGRLSRCRFENHSRQPP